VSADSFRKLTSLLKKSQSASLVVPEILVAPVVPQERSPIITRSSLVVGPPFVADAPTPVVQKPHVEEVVAPVITPPVEMPPVEVVALPEELPAVEQAMPELAEPLTIEEAPAPSVETAVDVLEAMPSEIQPEARDLIAPKEIVAEPEASQPFIEPLLEPQINSLRKSRLVRNKIAPPPPLPSTEDVPQTKTEAPAPVQTPEQEAEAAELARSLLDMMAQGSAAGQPQERALAADTLLRMLPRLPLKSRVMLASRLCIMEQPHHLLVAKLITDPEISVSGPLLEESAQLSDEDLLRVLDEKDPNKRRMMARRRKISRPVTTALIETDDASVLLTIARNAGAEITAEGFAMLERAARKRGELLAPMCIRADLPVHFAFSLFWLAPPELRRYLLTRFLTDSETLTKILKIARGTQGEDTGTRAPVDPQLVKLSLAKAAGGDFSGAAEPLAEMSSLAPETITRILEDRQGEPLMALLKTLSFPRSQVTDLVDTLKGGIIDPSRSAEDLQSLFDSLSFNKARILLTYWDWSSLGTGPYALVQ
jgi:hypothetical protein